MNTDNVYIKSSQPESSFYLPQTLNPRKFFPENIIFHKIQETSLNFHPYLKINKILSLF